MKALEAPLVGLKNVDALQGLPLRQLIVGGNQLSDLSALSGSETLVYLAVSDNDIAGLSNFHLPPPSERPPRPNTVHLEFDNNPLDDADVAPFCAQGWSVQWGPTKERSRCNEDWVWEDNPGGAR
jgi:hypothetical protein